MRTLFLIIVICFMAATVQASFLVCDPDLAFQGVKIQFDGGTWIEGTVLTNAQGTYLHHDLSGLTNGAHTVKAKSYNLWGESVETAPLPFTKAVPAAPLNVKITP